MYYDLNRNFIFREIYKIVHHWRNIVRNVIVRSPINWLEMYNLSTTYTCSICFGVHIDLSMAGVHIDLSMAGVHEYEKYIDIKFSARDAFLE